LNIKLMIHGRPGDYWRDTLYSWVLEVKDILEDEYKVDIEVYVVDEDVTLPYITDDEGFIVFNEVLEEPGYLIEYIKSYLNRRLRSY